MKKNVKFLILIFVIVLILFIISLTISYSKNNKFEEKRNIQKDNNNSANMENVVKPLYEVTDINEVEQNVLKTEEEPIHTKEEIDSYWTEYTDPNNWSEKTKKYTLAYSLVDDKYDNTDNYIVNADKIIDDCISDKKCGVYITKSSRIFVNEILEKDINTIFYIDDDGMLKYKSNQYYVNKPIDELLIYAIDNNSDLYILDTSFAYIDEEQGNTPYTMPSELDYLQFNIESNKKLLIYNLYNFQVETFLNGLQELTGKLLETK